MEIKEQYIVLKYSWATTSRRSWFRSFGVQEIKCIFLIIIYIFCNLRQRSILQFEWMTFILLPLRLDNTAEHGLFHFGSLSIGAQALPCCSPSSCDSLSHIEVTLLFPPASITLTTTTVYVPSNIFQTFLRGNQHCSLHLWVVTVFWISSAVIYVLVHRVRTSQRPRVNTLGENFTKTHSPAVGVFDLRKPPISQASLLQFFSAWLTQFNKLKVLKRNTASKRFLNIPSETETMAFWLAPLRSTAFSKDLLNAVYVT